MFTLQSGILRKISPKSVKISLKSVNFIRLGVHFTHNFYTLESKPVKFSLHLKFTLQSINFTPKFVKFALHL